MLTPESIIFGGSINAPVQARLAKAVGKSPATVCRWARDADKIPLGDLRKLVIIRGLNDKQIVQIVRGK